MEQCSMIIIEYAFIITRLQRFEFYLFLKSSVDRCPNTSHTQTFTALLPILSHASPRAEGDR